MIETKKTTEGKDSKENALLVLVKIKSKKDTINIEEEIEELKNLAISSGANIEGYIVHKQSEPTPNIF